MKKRVLIIAAAILVILIVAAAVGAWIYASHRLTRLEAYRHEITSSLEEALGRKVEYREAQAALTLRAGLSLRIDDLVVYEKDGPAQWVAVRSAFFRMALLPLIGGKIVLKEVLLDHPRVQVIRTQDGLLNIDDLLVRQPKPKFALSVRELSIEDGEILFTDFLSATGKRTASVGRISFQIDPYLWNGRFQVHLSAVLKAGGSVARLTATGKIRPSAAGRPMSETEADFTARIAGMDLSVWSAYIRELSPLKRVAGRADIDAAFAGTLKQFDTKGNVSVDQPVVDYPDVFSETLSFGRLSFPFNVSRKADRLTMEFNEVKADHFSVAVRLDWRELGADDPHLELVGSSSTLSRKDVATFVPWALIGEDIASFVNRHVAEGVYRLSNLKLSGRISQIRNMSAKDNADVLFLRAQVDRGVFRIDEKTPAFRDISGTMELKERMFHLQGMTGRFGDSPFALDGHISDYAASGPTVYTAEGRIEPSRAEVRWLAGAERFPELAFSGQAPLRLKGHGPADRFAIEADWNLTDASIGLPDFVSKPTGRSARLFGRIVLSAKSVEVESFTLDLPPLALNGAVSFRDDGKMPARLRVRAENLDLKNFSSLFPSAARHDPAGSLTADVGARGDFSDPSSLVWTGRVAFAGISFIPWKQAALVSGLSGRAVFKNSRMDTSSFKGRFGRSEVLGQCSVEKWRDPKLACRMSAPAVYASDAGLVADEGEVMFQNVRARFALDGDHFSVERLAAQTGKTTFTLAGDMPFDAGEEMTLSVSSPFIASDDILRLAGLKPREGTSASSGPIRLAATVNAGRVTVGRTELTNLKASLKLLDRRLDVNALTADVAQGRVEAAGRIAFPPGADNRYEASLSLADVSIEEVQQIMDLGDRVITGRLSGKADLVASGNDLDGILKTLDGNLDARAEKGMIRRFAVLSKIFSILNVSQLFRLKLPDMAKDGMPYTAMTGNFRLSAGVLSSENFLIDSNAMQISVLGRVDLINRTLDNIIGVHPLETLDRLAARIPVAGWILTDERGKLITVHFKAEGPWDNPQVTAIPAQSLGKGTLDIFRRIFELPEKLITDTGDVLLGR
ncbi:MAG TPA: AsmA-like C-terminal domain-containing protein [Smithellaceae bacterium]|nr:AsmA-like C-terminal domain-containing protein [Smithellaceae bacterium]